ncbi:MAG: glycoside hydrolase domain-containing protein, partial [Victivallaceae bacterium]
MPTKLKSVQGNGVLPAEAIDIKLVKCWYQGGTAWIMTNKNPKKVMVPELLLNDDSLVKVDTKKKENYLKLSFSEGEKYTWISDPNEKSDKSYKLLKNNDFPVKDSAKLLPVDIPGGQNQQFWVTIKVPADAVPGIYRGKINLLQAGRNIGNFSLELKVLPFKLLLPYYVSSVYYRGRFSSQYPDGTISSELKTETQLKNELKNMAEHGVTNPTCYQPFKNKKLLKKYLSLRKLAGMDAKDFYYCYGINVECGNSQKSREDLDKRVRSVLAFLKPYGIDEVYFYGRDEAKGDQLKAQRGFWDIIHKAGGKVFVAGTVNENFEKMGDIQDLSICAGKPSKEEAAKWHSKNHKIWCYFNPQGGVENPAVYRRNYGILLWQNDYDGACTFAYQASYGNIWNDFDSFMRDETFVYPTVDGVIDTIAWEGYREGVDDVRYLTTLLHELDKAKKENKAEKRNIILNAEKYL